MAQHVEWEKVEQPQPKAGQGWKGSRAGKVMKLEANTTHRVRPAGLPIIYYRVSNKLDGRFRSAIVDDPQKNPIFEKYPKLKAQVRYAVKVFDRDNNNQIQFLEGPGKLFEAFRHYKNMAKREPGGPESGDFQIQVVCPSGIKDRNTIYKVEFLESVKFTKAEHEEYQAKKAEFDLIEFFKPHTMEEIEQRLFKPWVDNAQSVESQTVTTVGAQKDLKVENIEEPSQSADENFTF